MRILDLAVAMLRSTDVASNYIFAPLCQLCAGRVLPGCLKLLCTSQTHIVCSRSSFFSMHANEQIRFGLNLSSCLTHTTILRVL